jgi:hypothetical protein
MECSKFGSPFLYINTMFIISIKLCSQNFVNFLKKWKRGFSNNLISSYFWEISFHIERIIVNNKNSLPMNIFSCQNSLRQVCLWIALHHDSCPIPRHFIFTLHVSFLHERISFILFKFVKKIIYVILPNAWDSFYLILA